MPSRALPLVLLLGLALAPLPTGGASIACEYDRYADHLLGPVLVHQVSHKCRYHDVFRNADVYDRLDRYDAYRQNDTLREEAGRTHWFAYYEHVLETTYRADGRTELVHETWFETGGAILQHKYLENRDASGKTSCHGAARFDPGGGPGRVHVPRTPDYPRCAPPGLLA